MSGVYARLKQAAGGKGFSEDPAEIAPYLEEWRGKYDGHTALLLKPDSIQSLSAILAICHETGTPIVPQGGNTGLVGGQLPLHGEVLLSLKRLNRVRRVDGASLTAEAGVTLAEAQAAAIGVDRLFPLTLASEGSCTIGGNIATNAGGSHVLRYGMMRSLVLGLEVVLADGRLLPMLDRPLKDNSGYDLKQVFIGSEGTLGVITAATLRLFPRPQETAVAFAAIADVAASLALLALMQEKSGGLVSAFELVPRFAVELVEKHIPGSRDPLAKPSPWYVLIEIAGGAAGMAALMEDALAAAMEKKLVTDALIAQNQTQGRALWRLRETISEAQKREGASIKHDISLPLSALPDFVAEATAAVLARYPGARPCSFGHVGDGNLHFNFNAPPGRDKEFLAEWDEIQLIVHDLVKTYGGSISAEHGIGAMKRDLLLRYKTTEELDAMRALKHAFDPKNILNPGKTVPPVYRL